MTAPSGRWWALPLVPLGLAFLGAARLKAALFGMGLKKRARLPAPALSVGNLTFGGTGKTPFTLHLARLALESGQHPAVLLRGYGRDSHGARRVEPGSPEREAGEEALLYATRLPGVPVAVGEGREKAAACIGAGPDLFLLDDGFQHQRVARDGDILLVDASRPKDLRVPPLGRLREPLRAALRADLLVVTRGCYEDLPRRLRDLWGDRPRIHARFRWDDALGPSGAGPLSEWRDRPLVCFAGIGHPEAFFDQSRREGLRLVEALPFPDHARATPERIHRVAQMAIAADAAAVLTTEKDALKWLPLWKAPVPLLFPRLVTEIEDPDGHLRALLTRVAGEPR